MNKETKGAIRTANWWKTLNRELKYEFGMMQVDIAGHSKWSGNIQDQQKTKERLKLFIEGIASVCYDAEKLGWQGDGGQFIFLIRNQNVDSLVTCCIHILKDMSLFNSLRSIWTYLDFPVSLRISAHMGSVLFNGDKETLHGDSLNFFIKSERGLSETDTVSITEDVFEQLRNKELRDTFFPIEDHDLMTKQGKYRGRIYRSRKIDFECKKAVGNIAEAVSECIDPTKRYWIYIALGKIGGEEAKITIEYGLSDNDAFARSGAETAWQELTGNAP